MLNPGYFLFCVLLSAFLFSNYAQEKKAFETFSFGGSYVSNVNEETLHNYWSSGSGFEGYFATPFFIGNFQVGLTYLPFEGKTESYPDFNSYLIYVQWGYRFYLPHNFSLSVDALTGIDQLDFDESAEAIISEGEIAEREIAIGLSSTISFEIVPTWNLNFLTSYQRIYTKERIDLINLSIGLSKSFDSPEWLKDFLE
ncbi:MAG TPA: hypothetical protein VH917_00395 [Ignavibacteriaceae bacterium]|jgi:hypothetical protein